MRILLVEDEPRAAQMLAKGLREEAYAVDVVGDGERAVYQAAITDYDAIILDVVLPLAGWPGGVPRDPARRLRRAGADADGARRGRRAHCGPRQRRGRLPDEAVRLRRTAGAAAGGDSPRPAAAAAVDHAGRAARLDTRARRAFRRGEPLILTAREYALLEHLALHADEVVGRASIAEHVWDTSYEAMSNAIDVCVQRLRRKIDDAGQRSLIVTRRGEGLHAVRRRRQRLRRP